MKTMMKCLVMVLLVGTVSTRLMAQWVQTYLPGDGVRVLKLAVSETGLFADTGGDLYRYTFGGNRWTNIGYGSYPEFIVVKDSMIFRGSLTMGLSRSTDNGNNWSNINTNLPADKCIRCMVRYKNTLLVGTNFGVYFSNDNGITWSRNANYGLTNQIVMSLVIISNEIGNTNLFATTAGSVYRSSDLGYSWNDLNSGIESNSVKKILAAVPDGYGGTILYAWKSGVIQYSTNNGISWTKCSNSPTDLRAFTASDTLLFAAYGGVLYSASVRDNSWKPVSHNFQYIDCLAIRGTDLFAGSDNGVFLSTNNGATWNPMNNGFNPDPTAKAFAANTNGLFVGTNAGVFSSSDGGNSWTKTTLGSIEITTMMTTGDTLFAGTHAGIFRTSTNGTHWTFSELSGVTALAAATDKSNSSIIFAGRDWYVDRDAFSSGAICRSTDNGISWTKTALESVYVTSIAVSKNTEGENSLFASTSDGIFLSTDYGERWTLLDSSLTNITSLVTIPNGSGGMDIFAGGVGDFQHFLSGGIYRFTNNGKEWMKTTLATINGHSFAYTEKYIFAGTSSGIFLSTDNGNSWSSQNSGLINGDIGPLLVSHSNLFVGIGSNGVWQRPISEMIPTYVGPLSAQLPVTFSLEQNFPNPFNPTTTIRYVLPSSANVKLSVYDLLGREIATLVNEEQSAGWKEVAWNAIGQSSGIYFYKLTAGNFVEVKKMSMLK